MPQSLPTSRKALAAAVFVMRRLIGCRDQGLEFGRRFEARDALQLLLARKLGGGKAALLGLASFWFCRSIISACA